VRDLMIDNVERRFGLVNHCRRQSNGCRIIDRPDGARDQVRKSARQSNGFDTTDLKNAKALLEVRSA
jgi:hypothetical protein